VTGTGSAPEISVVAPTYRRPERLRRLLDSLEAQTLDPARFEVVVVDDSSGDETADVLAERRASSPLRLEVRTTPRNGGPALARNLGWRVASAPLLAFTDDDCVPEPGWLAAGLDAMADEGLGVVQGRTVATDDGPSGRWVVRREVPTDSPWFEACNIFYRRDAFEQTGGFDEAIGWFGEDTSAGWRVVDAGWRRGFAPDAVVVHDLEDRGMRWRVRHGFLERNLVALSFDHPSLRTEWFWRPWSMGPHGPHVVAALVGLVVGPRWRPALVATVPYLWRRRHLVRRDPVLAVGVAVVDVAQVVGHLAGSLPRGRVVL
jgi:GT2 family glycosyltransferase